MTAIDPQARESSRLRVAMLDPSRLSWVYSHHLCEGLANHDVAVTLVTSPFAYGDAPEVRGYTLQEDFYRRTTRLYRGAPRGFLRRYVKGAEHVANMLTLKRALKRVGPDVIHFQQTPTFSIERWIVPRLKSIAPVIGTIHNTTPFHGEGGGLQLAGFQSFLQQLDHLIVHTSYSERQLVEHFGIAADKITVLEGGLYDYSHDPTTTAVDPSGEDDTKTILFFGNISEYKGVDVLLRAFAQMPAVVRDRARLLIAGNPQMAMAPLEELANELDISHAITWRLEFIPQEDVASVFAQSDVVALPYRHIDRSGVLTAALSHGKPVVVSRVGGFTERIDEGIQGYLVEPDDPSALAEKLAAVISDPAKAREMGAAARAAADGFRTWDAVAKETLDVYQRVIDRARA